MVDTSDQEILDQFRAGQQEKAFQALVERHGKTMYNIALFTLNDELLAEDVTQDAFIRIYRGLPRFKGEAQLASWIYRIVKNVCYDYLGKRQTDALEDEVERKLYDRDDPTPEEGFFQNESHQLLRQAVAQLPDSQKMAVTLYYFRQQSYEEIAAVMEEPLNTVKSHLYRAKRALARTVQPCERSWA